ncbi:MAG TPA: TonB-dependent receptor [Gemmatimonadaceae bacterium]|jgi:TonB-dependent receptor|nr:TonB-dependent receptor [Gemmatimonadaceae bacterium]
MGFFTRRALGGAVMAAALALPLRAQGTGGTISGRVADSTGKPLLGAVVRVLSTRLGARVDDNGAYSIADVPAGRVSIAAALPGFGTDTASVTVAEGQTVRHNFVLRVGTHTLKTVQVLSPRLAETKAAALDSMKNADNLKYVESGDDIRSLPSLNAAEAAERIPGVTTERDEGEGKFIQIRGTEPKLQNVTIDGTHIPGTLSGDRSVKLDDIPSDIIGAIEVSKTLSADMDADAIGGSVNIVTKIPETTPRGYVSGQFGYTTLQDRNAGQVGFTYGGRMGSERQFGFLIGASYDRNDRPINDMEGSWQANALGNGFFPNDFNHRQYFYYRQRWGTDLDLDYKFDSKTMVFVRGLFSRFLDHGNRYVLDLAASNDSVANNVRTHTADQGSASRQSQNRTPTENTYGLTAGFKKDDLGPFKMDATFNLGGSSDVESDYRTSQFNYTGNNVAYAYDNSNVTRPLYSITDPVIKSGVYDPKNFTLNNYSSGSLRSVAVEAGGSLNVTAPYTLGEFPAYFKFGGRFRNLTKTYDVNNYNFTANPLASITLAQLQGALTNQHFYQEQFPNGGINLGILPSNDLTTKYENANHNQFTRNLGDPSQNAVQGYFGNERVSAGYIMHDIDIGRLHINTGIRLESTYQEYRGHTDTSSADANSYSTAHVQAITGRHTYNDWFPSAQLRYAVDDATNVRIAVTKGIARPDYSALAPSVSGTNNSQFARPSDNTTIVAGNSKLKPEYAWNYDFLVERYLGSSGIISGGVFYKDLKNFIYSQRFVYHGPIIAYQGATGVEPQNGPGGHIIGWEVDWEQHFTFLPSVLSGLGFAGNWTHVNSHAVVPHSDGTPGAFRESLFRTAPDVGNISGLYAYGPVSARVAWVYQGPMIAAYGSTPGSTDPTQGDNYFYSHAQVDGSLSINVLRNTQFQFQVLNANDAVFGFFNGTLKHQFTYQREYYGRTFYAGLRQSF